MAYNFPTATQDFGYGIGETEEERRRREEEERQRREQEAAMQAQQQAEAQAQAQREQQEQQLRAQQQAAPGQSVAEIPAGMAAPNQFGSAIAQGQTSEGPPPTQGGPVAPDQANIEEQRRLQQAQQEQAVQAAQAQQPVAPVAPEQAQQPQAAAAAPGATAPMTMEERIAAAAQRAQERAAASSGQQPQPQAEAEPAAPVMPQLPQPGPGVQVASVEPGAGVAEAAKAQQAQQASQMPSASVGSLQQVAQQQTTALNHVDDVATIYNDPAKLLAYSKDESKPREGRLMAAKLLKQQVKSETEKQEAEDTIRKAEETGDTTFLDRALRSRKEEGSYLKAILYARLGLNKLAEDEQQKLGAGAKWQAVIGPNNERALVQYDAQGLPISGMDTAGRELTNKQLAMFGTNALPTQAHLMPSTIGGLMQKTIIGEDGKPTVVTGAVVRDPRNPNAVYFEANGKRYDTTGLSTPAQNVQNVYSAAGAKQQGTQAAQTGTTFVGGQEGGQGAVDPAAVQRAQGDIAAADREIAQLNRLPANDPTKQQRIAIVTQERNKAQQQLQQLGGVPGGAAGTGGLPQTGGAGGMLPGENFVQYQERIRRQGAEAQAAAEANIALGKEERSNFLTYEEKEIVPKADAGGSIASTRKSQLKGPDGILANPEIVGMMQGQGGTAAEVGNIIRDLVTGEKDNEELSRRVASLNLTQRQKDVLYNQIGLNRQIAPKTLKENAGAGSVSDAEQKANREAAVDVTRVPLYTAVTLLSKDQFDKDQQVARAAFRQANPGLTTVRAFNDAWGKEKSKLDAEYNQIYAARAQYIKKYYNDGQNPGAIVDAYKHYPVPEFNRQTGRWDYGTDYARRAARPKLSSFER